MFGIATQSDIDSLTSQVANLNDIVGRLVAVIGVLEVKVSKVAISQSDYTETFIESIENFRTGLKELADLDLTVEFDSDSVAQQIIEIVEQHKFTVSAEVDADSVADQIMDALGDKDCDGFADGVVEAIEQKVSDAVVNAVENLSFSVR